MQKGIFILCRTDSENTDFPLRGMLLEDLGKIEIVSYPLECDDSKQLLIGVDHRKENLRRNFVHPKDQYLHHLN